MLIVISDLNYLTCSFANKAYVNLDNLCWDKNSTTNLLYETLRSIVSYNKN